MPLMVVGNLIAFRRDIFASEHTWAFTHRSQWCSAYGRKPNCQYDNWYL